MILKGLEQNVIVIGIRAAKLLSLNQTLHQ
jgi:hypothetical protein